MAEREHRPAGPPLRGRGQARGQGRGRGQGPRVANNPPNTNARGPPRPHPPHAHKHPAQRPPPQPQGQWAKSIEPAASSAPSSARMETVAKLQQKTSTILQQYREQNLLDDSDSDNSADDDDKIDNSIFKQYNQIAGETAMGERTKHIIQETQRGASRCLVCLDKVKPQDAIWQCEQCYCLLHLMCIQQWIKEGTAYNAIEDTRKENWYCPKCRKEHTMNEVPRKYKCFCEKVVDPPFDMWSTPHSCGQLCDKSLKPACGHKCTLLCHPGPCPPCPQTVKALCHCARTSQMVRCANKLFSCGKICKSPLACGLHTCEEVCHPGACPLCKKESERRCRCGKVKEVKPCCESDFSCEIVCGKSFSCGKHICEKVCHAGPCGPCPLSGPRTCPCGRRAVTLPCDQQIPSCGGTCEKTLLCGRHSCQQRCHNGPCPVCRTILVKHCRCGQTKKEVMCCNELLCEKRCPRTRNCRRHQCNKKCCPGNCPPCAEPCDRKLNCGNHKCESICHSGPCYPCPRTVDVTCFCGMTKTTVPCGRETQTKPPKCRYVCRIPPTCHHDGRQPHACHFGPCPPCTLVCEAPLPECPHDCPHTCHDPIPAIPAAKKGNKAKPLKPLPKLTLEKVVCPPCEVIVERWCRGEHESRQIKCSGPREYSCVRSCGNPLECGNHLCSRCCHVITKRRKQVKDSEGRVVEVVPDILAEEDATSIDQQGGASEDQKRVGEEGEEREEEEYYEEEEGEYEYYEEEDACDPCPLPCQRPRNPPCPHPCPLPCHLGPCPECIKLVKHKCLCGSTFLSMECHVFTKAKDTEAIKCCGQNCMKNLPACIHECKQICHSGPCAAACSKVVTAKCSCGRIKMEISCNKAQELRRARDVQKKEFLTLLGCDEQCEELKKETARLKKEKESEAAATSSREPTPHVKYDTKGQKIVEKSRKKEILGARKTLLQRVRHFFSRNQKYFVPPIIAIGVCLFILLYSQVYTLDKVTLPH